MGFRYTVNIGTQTDSDEKISCEVGIDPIDWVSETGVDLEGEAFCLEINKSYRFVEKADPMRNGDLLALPEDYKFQVNKKDKRMAADQVDKVRAKGVEFVPNELCILCCSDEVQRFGLIRVCHNRGIRLGTYEALRQFNLNKKRIRSTFDGVRLLCDCRAS